MYAQAFLFNKMERPCTRTHSRRSSLRVTLLITPQGERVMITVYYKQYLAYQEYYLRSP